MRACSRNNFFFGTIVILTIASAWNGRAFSLLGPFQSWMQQTNDLRQQGDIGGPMCISNGYRWNVPVVTYGFDPSFINFFGTNGTAAVESAFQIMNDLPPASDLALTNYPFDSIHFNGIAQGQYLLDLKSATLSVLLEQMGLAQPTRYTFVLRQWNPVFSTSPGEYNYESDWPDWVFPDYISEMNFDPQTLIASTYVNGLFYTAEIATGGHQNYVIPFSTDTTVPQYTAVADRNLQLGGYYTGLTYDDVGGLCYLLSTNNVEYETLLPNVSGVGTNPIVNGAWRPGVNKITFVPQPVNPVTGAFLAMTNCYTDTYISNGVPMRQRVARVVSQPDFLFCAGNVDYGTANILNNSGWAIPILNRTGTTSWINNAALNGNAGGGGPGIIQPQVTITFGKLGSLFQNITDESAEQTGPAILWGTFDGTTNLPIVYPACQSGTTPFDIRMELEMPVGAGFFDKEFDWPLTNAAGSVSLLQTSCNLKDWVTLFPATNNGSIWMFLNDNPSSNQRFYRVVPQ